jgi:hypothetical protein
MLGLKINTSAIGVYSTDLTDTEIQQLKDRLENFNFEVDQATQYAEIEGIMNKLNGTLKAESDQMDLGSLFSVMEKVKMGSKRVSKPYEFVNVLLKIVGHIKRQVGGMNRNITIKRPRHKAAWNAVFSNTKKKGGTRKNLPKSNTPAFRKQVINTIMTRRNLTNYNKARLIQRYEEAARAGLATPNEISALVGLAELKHYGKKTL